MRGVPCPPGRSPARYIVSASGKRPRNTNSRAVRACCGRRPGGGVGLRFEPRASADTTRTPIRRPLCSRSRAVSASPHHVVARTSALLHARRRRPAAGRRRPQRVDHPSRSPTVGWAASPRRDHAAAMWRNVRALRWVICRPYTRTSVASGNRRGRGIGGPHVAVDRPRRPLRIATRRSSTAPLLSGGGAGIARASNASWPVRDLAFFLVLHDTTARSHRSRRPVGILSVPPDAALRDAPIVGADDAGVL